MVTSTLISYTLKISLIEKDANQGEPEESLPINSIKMLGGPK
jgi:hypothetical protein